MRAIFNASDILAAATSAGKDQSRKVLTGIYFEANEGSYRVTACDSCRLATVTRERACVEQPGTALLPAKELCAALKPSDKVIIEADGASAKVSIYAKKAALRAEIILREIEGTYPSFKKLLPGSKAGKEGAPYAHMNPEYLAGMAKAAGLFKKGAPLTMACPDTNGPAFFQVDDEGACFVGLIMPIRFDAPKFKDYYLEPEKDAGKKPEAAPEPEEAPETKAEAPEAKAKTPEPEAPKPRRRINSRSRMASRRAA